MSFRYGFAFGKDGPLVFISHLDLLRLLARAMRRADVPVTLSQGFSPRPKLRLSRALKVGVASPREEGEVFLDECWEPSRLKERLAAALPPGIELKDVWQMSGT
jgi:radical SAM-linked protein